MSTRHVVIVSLGNPKPYEDTYHSAGHIVLDALQQRYPSDHPPFKSDSVPEKRTMKSIGPRYTLLKSPVLMNVSGRFVNRAWLDSVGDRDPKQVPLVVIHDDLEEDLGVVKVRNWTQSHRGHNGIRDCIAKVRGPKDHKFMRISLGIGRPDSRDRENVSDFVLSPVTQHARNILTGEVVALVRQALEDQERRWDLMDAESARKPPGVAGGPESSNLISMGMLLAARDNPHAEISKKRGKNRRITKTIADSEKAAPCDLDGTATSGRIQGGDGQFLSNDMIHKQDVASKSGPKTRRA